MVDFGGEGKSSTEQKKTGGPLLVDLRSSDQSFERHDIAFGHAVRCRIKQALEDFGEGIEYRDITILINGRRII